MGYATATFSLDSQMIWGSQRVNVVKVSCTSYDTSGIQIAAGDCGLGALSYLVPFFVGAGSVSNGPVIAWWDSTNAVLKLQKATNADVDASTNITTAGYIYCLAIGQ